MDLSKKTLGIMAEPISIYSLAEESHLHFKNSIVEIVNNAQSIDPHLKRASQTGIFHISNRRGQNIFSDFPGLDLLREVILQCCTDFVATIG